MKILKNAFIYFNSNNLNLIIPLISIILIAKILGAKELGILALIQSVGSLTSSITFLGLSSTYEREFFKNKDINKELLLLNFLFVILISNLIFFFIINILYNIFVYHLPILPITKYQLILGHFSVMLGNLLMLPMIFFRNLKNPIKYSIIQLNNNALPMLASVILIFFYNFKILIVLENQIIFRLFIILILLFLILKKNNFKIYFNRMIKIIKYSIFLLPKSIMSNFINHIDKYILAGYFNLELLGAYNLAQKFGGAFVSMCSFLDNLYLPTISKLMLNNKSKISFEKIGKIVTPFFYLSTGLCLMFAILSQILPVLLDNENFNQLYLLILIMCPYYCILFFGKQNQLIYAKKINTINYLMLIKFISFPILNFFLIIKYQSIGAALATVISGIFMITISQYFANKCYAIKWELKKLTLIMSYFFIAVIILIYLEIFSFNFKISIIVNSLLILIFFVLGLGINFDKKFFNRSQ